MCKRNNNTIVTFHVLVLWSETNKRTTVRGPDVYHQYFFLFGLFPSAACLSLFIKQMVMYVHLFMLFPFIRAKAEEGQG